MELRQAQSSLLQAAAAAAVQVVVAVRSSTKNQQQARPRFHQMVLLMDQVELTTDTTDIQAVAVVEPTVVMAEMQRRLTHVAVEMTMVDMDVVDSVVEIH
jgi:hypothetical protein